MAEHKDENAHDNGHGKSGGHKSHGPPHGGGHGDGEHEGAPEWLISFADNVALMMGFFVILLAMNMGPKASGADGEGEGTGGAGANTADMLDLALAIREAFNNPVSINSTNPREAELVARLREKFRGSANDEGSEGKHDQVQSLRQSDYHNFYGAVFFTTQTDQITATSRSNIKEIAQKLRGLQLIIEIRGHVSSAEAYDKPDHGMKLSFERALAAAQALSAEGIDWRQLRLIPSGDNDRLRPAAVNPMEHAENQRAEVILTDELLPR